MNISEFERKKPRKTYKAIQKLISKYKYIVEDMQINKEEDLTKIEMSADFLKELEKIMKVFKSGE
tara:strand:+ start:593 stop:787 length:195 start_codon:yes stop_codon:yes gene_type:complete